MKLNPVMFRVKHNHKEALQRHAERLTREYPKQKLIPITIEVFEQDKIMVEKIIKLLKTAGYL